MDFITLLGGACIISAADWPVPSLPQLQPAAGRPASPWGEPEMF
jgi:hypothetical protein